MDVTVCMGRGQGQGLGSAFGGVSRSEVGMGGVCSTGGSQTSTLVLDPLGLDAPTDVPAGDESGPAGQAREVSVRVRDACIVQLMQ
jgi:hypothetical protein